MILLTVCFLIAPICGTEPRDSYGGHTAVEREATGFFRVEEIGNRWYFITPNGHPYIALGANHVGSFLKEQASDNSNAAAEKLLQSLLELGLNAGDAYQPEPRFAERLPWICGLYYHQKRDRGRLPPNIFDPTQVVAMQKYVASEAAKIAGNPWVIGLVGPDLPQWDSSYALPYRTDRPGSLARAGYEAFLRKRHETIASLNVAYGTQFEDWEAVAAEPGLPLAIRTPKAVADEHAFLALIADRHFAAFRAACKEGAPNHLFLGERTQLHAIHQSVLKAMAPHLDVFCTQSLIRLPKSPPEWQVFQRAGYDREFDLVKKPMIIIDWAAPFTLADQPVHTPYGTLKPEREAGKEAAQFVLDAFEPPYMVGLFVCQVIGSHPNDRLLIDAKRTYLKDDAGQWSGRSIQLRNANRSVLETLYRFSSEAVD